MIPGAHLTLRLTTRALQALRDRRRNKDNRAVLSVLLITFPFCACALRLPCRTARRCCHAVSHSGLNAFVLYFALPACCTALAPTPIGKLLDPAVAGVYVLCAW